MTDKLGIDYQSGGLRFNTFVRFGETTRKNNNKIN